MRSASSLACWIPDGREKDSRTPLAAIREAAGDGVEVLHVPGLKNDLDEAPTGFAEAVAAANKADVVVLIVGERANLSGEARSRAILDLPGAQRALVEAVAATGKPIVLVVQAGRPLTIGKRDCRGGRGALCVARRHDGGAGDCRFAVGRRIAVGQAAGDVSRNPSVSVRSTTTT